MTGGRVLLVGLKLTKKNCAFSAQFQIGFHQTNPPQRNRKTKRQAMSSPFTSHHLTAQPTPYTASGLSPDSVPSPPPSSVPQSPPTSSPSSTPYKANCETASNNAAEKAATSPPDTHSPVTYESSPPKPNQLHSCRFAHFRD